MAFTHVRTPARFRGRETADLLARGPATVAPHLGAFFADRGAAAAQTAATLAALAAPPPGSRPMLVTHQANAAALPGVAPRPGEIAAAVPDGSGGLRLAGRLDLTR